MCIVVGTYEQYVFKCIGYMEAIDILWHHRMEIVFIFRLNGGNRTSHNKSYGLKGWTDGCWQWGPDILRVFISYGSPKLTTGMGSQRDTSQNYITQTDIKATVQKCLFVWYAAKVTLCPPFVWWHVSWVRPVFRAKSSRLQAIVSLNKALSYL